MSVHYKPEPSAFEVEMAIEKLKKRPSSGASSVRQKRTALFQVVMRQVVVLTDVSRQPVGPIFKDLNSWILKDRTDRLSWNVGKKLPVLAV